jgi:putative ABC transport system substrate-binding protein
MKRREFIAGLGAAAWSLVARAQQGLARRVGILIGVSQNESEMQSSLAVLIQELARLGWVEGRNVRIDRRWSNDDADLERTLAKELAELQPDVILAVTSTATAALQWETRTIPIVFAIVADPVGQGFVAGLPRPGGNLTGFGYIEAAFVGKQLQMIKEIASGIRRVAFMYNPDFAPWAKSFRGPFEVAAQGLGVDPIIVPVRSDAEIETALDALGREEGGLISPADPFMTAHRAAVIAAATRNKVPTIYAHPAFAREGGLMSYEPSFSDIFRGAAGYVDRILKGEKPADLPVQLPTRYDLVINLKTAKAIGLTIPESFLLRADEVIE